MRHENEKVNMLALTVRYSFTIFAVCVWMKFPHSTPYLLQLLEACVKNCGQRFHQELGKFRFLNELIKMLSEKVSYMYIRNFKDPFLIVP